MLSFNSRDCIFCKIHINFYTEAYKVVPISIHLDEDGDSVRYSFWSHKDCLPQALKEALGF